MEENAAEALAADDADEDAGNDDDAADDDVESAEDAAADEAGAEAEEDPRGDDDATDTDDTDEDGRSLDDDDDMDEDDDAETPPASGATDATQRRAVQRSSARHSDVAAQGGRHSPDWHRRPEAQSSSAPHRNVPPGTQAHAERHTLKAMATRNAGSCVEVTRTLCTPVAQGNNPRRFLSNARRGR